MMSAVLVGLLVTVVAWFVARPLVGSTGDARPLVGRHRTVVVAGLTVAAVCGGAVLARAVEPGAAGASSGRAPAPAAAGSSPVATPTPSSTPATAATPDAASTPPTDAQLAAISSAVARVRARPRDVAAHLDLARAYAEGQQAQLSAVEYLAVVRLDPANPEASSALALVALAAGRPAEGKRLVDAVLVRHPRYPDALYTRGLIYVMGLHQAAPGVRDLRAYLAAAPYGSHRPAVQTLLAMLSDGRTP
jgi:hypothetical protein